MAAGAPPSPPLSVPPSQALVAFTIELDNEFEHRMDHRTASRRPTGPGAAIDDLRTALLAHRRRDGGTPLYAGLEPYPDGKRASVRRPATLPH